MWLSEQFEFEILKVKTKICQVTITPPFANAVYFKSENDIILFGYAKQGFSTTTMSLVTRSNKVEMEVDISDRWQSFTFLIIFSQLV